MNTTSVKEKNTTASKTIQVLARYFIKATFAVVYLILNGSGKRYLVTLNANGTSGCVDAETGDQCTGCEYGHVCYHKMQCIEIEGARGLYIQEHDTLAGFRFVAPLEEKVKKERKPRAYNYEVPTHTLAMKNMVLEFQKTTSKSKRKAFINLFSSMASEKGLISIDGTQWYYDADILSIFEVVQVSDQCPQDVVPSDEEVLPELPSTEETTFNDEPLSVEEAALFEHVDNEEIVLQDELHEAPKEPTRAQVISSIRHGVQQLVDFDPDYATNDNGMGPNGTDTIFMHNLADRMNRDEPIPVKKWVSAAQKLQRYNRTQLGGIIPPMPVVEKALLGTSIEAGLAARGLMR